MTKRPLNKLCLAIILVLSFAMMQTSAQSVKRECIASSSGLIVSKGISVQQTIGQAYSAVSNYSEGIIYRPGYQQPVTNKSSVKAKPATPNTFSQEIDVYPNPSSVSFNVEFQEACKSVKIDIRDITGKLIWEEYLFDVKKCEVPCADWTAGMYLITLYNYDNQQQYNSKILITK